MVVRDDIQWTEVVGLTTVVICKTLFKSNYMRLAATVRAATTESKYRIYACIRGPMGENINLSDRSTRPLALLTKVDHHRSTDQ